MSVQKNGRQIFNDSDINNPDIDGGTADSMTIGGTTPAAGTFTAVNNLILTEAVNSFTIAGGTGTARTLTVDETKSVSDKMEKNGSNIALGSDADGDIYYRANGVLTRLAKGTAEQVLKMNSGATAPEWGEGGSDKMNKDGSNLAIGSDADGDMYYRASGVLARVSEADRGMLLAAHLPGTYSRNELWSGGIPTDAESRRTLVSPSKAAIFIGSAGYVLTSATSLDLNTAANWDDSHYVTAANRAGKDFYVYACIPASGVEADLLLSDNPSVPAGKTTENSRRVGGFHCLCANVGAIADHWLTGYLTGDILPRSVWDLVHRPRCNDTRGMVYSTSGHWVDIYLPSIDSDQLASISGAAFVTGDTAVKFHWYKFSQWLGRIGKRMPTQTEFQALSIGSNQGTNIAGSANPVTTGGHSDTASRRMISNIGCEDCCGVLWQWGEESGEGGTDAFEDAYDANDADVAGQHERAPNRVAFGGPWAAAQVAGSRCSYWNAPPLHLLNNAATRGISEPL